MRNEQKLSANKLMKVLEQVGWYGSLFLMVFHIGIEKAGFRSIEAFLVYAFGNVILIVLYWILWILYFIKAAY